MNGDESTDRLLDVEQCARILRCAPVTVRRAIERGELPALRIGEAGGIRVAERNLGRLLVPYRRRSRA